MDISVKTFLKKPWCNWEISLTLTQHLLIYVFPSLWSYFETEYSALLYSMPLLSGSVPFTTNWSRGLVSSQELQPQTRLRYQAELLCLPFSTLEFFLVVMTPFKST